MDTTRVPGSRNVRIELSEEEAHKLVRGIGVLDDVQIERLDDTPSSVQDVVSQFVVQLADELKHFNPTR